MFRPSEQPRLAQQQMAQLRDWVDQSIEQHGVWRVSTPDGDWYCPYCAQGLCFGADLDSHPEQVIDHLATACDPFDEIGSTPIFPEGELRRRALPAWIREWLKTDQAWHVRDEAGRWACPYCMELTGIRVADGRVNREVFEALCKHVLVCPAYDPLRPEQYTPHEELRRKIARQTTQVRGLTRIEQLIKEQEVWRVTLPGGQWACPYCREPVDSVMVQAPLDLTLNAPPKIYRHLASCAAYRERRAPAGSAAELYDVAAGNRSGPTPITRVVAPERQTQSVVQSELMEKALNMAMALEEKAVEMDQDLSAARVRQLAMLPDAPELPGYDIAVTYKPCSLLGGDFYDFNRLEDGRMGIAIGDVTGHGATAALVMAITKKVLSMAARLDPEPERSVAVTNEEMCKDLDTSTFVTLLYGVLDPQAALLRFVRAGHDPLLLYNPLRCPPVLALKPAGMAVGLTAGARFEKMLEPHELHLVPGDLLVLWTDGVTEIQNHEGEEFGQERLEQVVAAAPEDATAGDVLELIEIACRRFAGTRPFEDDFTLMVLRYLGS